MMEFKYSQKEKLTNLVLFLGALLFPVLIGALSIASVVLLHPGRALSQDDLYRLGHFFRSFIFTRDPWWGPIISVGGWLLLIFGTLPKAIITGLVLKIDNKGVVATFHGWRWKSFSWGEVKRIEASHTREFDGLIWKPASGLKIVLPKGNLPVRDSILNYFEFRGIVRKYTQEYKIPFVTGPHADG